MLFARLTCCFACCVCLPIIVPKDVLAVCVRRASVIKRGIAMALSACYNVFADCVKKFCSLCIFICKSVFYSPRISPAVWYSGGVKNSQKSKL